MSGKGKRKSDNPYVHFLSGGIAGCSEALMCHPLDTIKVRMQLNSRAAALAKAQTAEVAASVGQAARKAGIAATQVSGSPAVGAEARSTLESAAKNIAKPAATVQKRGFLATGVYIAKSSGIKGLYRGLGAVIAGITPKMAVRFWAFEESKRLLTVEGTPLSTMRIFTAGVIAGIVESLAVVNPSDVVKIRLQAQTHSLMEPGQQPKYRNALHCLFTMIREEGVGSLYRGVWLTCARQATNQGTNFTAYTLIRNKLVESQPEYNGNLPSWQTSLIGLTSGAMGPLSNAPLDTIKTRMQRERKQEGEKGLAQFTRIGRDLVRKEGYAALYRGIVPRVMRVAPGQAVTFTVYEYASRTLEAMPIFKKPLAA